LFSFLFFFVPPPPPPLVKIFCLYFKINTTNISSIIIIFARLGMGYFELNNIIKKQTTTKDI